MRSIKNYNSVILIVDDEAANLQLLVSMLTTKQYQIRIASNGQRAIDSVKLSPPDLILLDINLPDLDGYQICSQIKALESNRDIPVIFISSNDNAIDKVKAFAVGGIDYVTKPFQLEEVMARIECQLKLAYLSRELNLQMLRYQLNPHFLFNALNSLSALTYEDGERTRKMISQLSHYLRYLLISRDDAMITIGEELAAIKNYLDIEKIRFEEAINCSIEIDINNKDILIPGFILQPLVENAIKYGMKTSPEPLEIKLSAYIKDHILYLHLTNSGHWVDQETTNSPQRPGLGVGQQNVRWRLQQHYPGQNCLSIFEENGKVQAIVNIPLKQ